MTKPMGPEYESSQSSQETEVRVGHSGDLNLERPSNPGAKIHDSPIQDADDIPPTMHYTDEERAEARRIQDEHLKRETTPIAEEEKEAWHQKTKNRLFAGGAAALAIIAFSFIATAGEDDVDTSKSALTNAPEDIARHNERVGNTSAEEDETESPENTDNFEPINQDFRPEDERNTEYSPEFVLGDDANEVLSVLFGNFERAFEEIEPGYITFYAYDENSSYANEIKSSIKSLDNNYPVTLDYEVISETKFGNEWHMQVKTKLDAEPVFSGDEQTRNIILKQKELARYDSESDELVTVYSWAILSDKIIS